ncbi:hypothetical protein [Thalassobacillus cyri]|uniref:hypothetical protein n=1 Tax=Thalassobacillus cyri TaxID=571932 RepID=UPI001C4097D8|nr:hypothetical protein [Thalassobacillus cyri]
MGKNKGGTDIKVANGMKINISWGILLNGENNCKMLVTNNGRSGWRDGYKKYAASNTDASDVSNER